MKIEGTIYFFAPLEKDFNSRDDLREHLARPTAGRLFLKKNEKEQWTIPFGSITHLVSILNDVNSNEISDLDFTIDGNKPYEETFNIKDRRCFRVKIQSVNPNNEPLKYAGYLGGLAKEKLKCSELSDSSIGVLIQLDIDEDNKYYKMYFNDFFDAGVKLDRMFTVEVRKRILTEEKYAESLAISYNDEVDNIKSSHPAHGGKGIYHTSW
jgi:hypothetical protein